jgi:hypothetical protein
LVKALWTKWTDVETKYLLDNFKNRRMQDIAKELDRTYPSVCMKLKKMNLYWARKRYPTIQLNLPETEWAYIAGLIDGEGTVTFSLGTPDLSEHRTHYTIYPNLHITNTSPIFYKYFQALGLPIQVRQPNPKYNCLRPCYTVTVGRLANILEFLNHVLPYLKIKHDEALMVIDFCNSRTSRSERAYSEHEKELVKKVLLKHMKGEKNSILSYSGL